MRLLDFVWTRKWPMGLAIGLVLVENIAWIVEPSLFGPVLDALISTARKEPGTTVVLPLTLWIGAFAINSGVGALRRAVDPRIYLTAYADVASEIVRSGRADGQPAGVVAGRVQLSREFITFLQYRVPETVEQLIAIGGAVIGLAFFDYRIALTCTLILVPLYVVQRWYGSKVLGLQSEVHDRMETAYDTLAARDPAQVREYFMDVARPQQRIANWGAASFGLMRLVLLGLFLVVLFVAIDLDDFSTGQLYSIVAYIWTFISSSEYLPELLESWTQVRDLSVRLRTAAS